MISGKESDIDKNPAYIIFWWHEIACIYSKVLINPKATHYAKSAETFTGYQMKEIHD
jgi:hypothetical protein